MSAADGVDALFARLRERPAGVPAVVEGGHGLDGPALATAADAFADILRMHGARVVATLLDNGIAWTVTDLAALRAGVVHVPLPAFFTREQQAHVLAATAADSLVATAPVDGFQTLLRLPFEARPQLARRTIAPVPMPAGTAKVTFTSGTTAAPKGVCLAATAMLDAARGVAQALAPLAIERHLAALPLALLLENLAGVYAPLWHGATVVLAPMATVGLSGSSTFDPARLDACVRAAGAHSIMVLPQMLRAWTAWRRAHAAGAETSLRFVAVGGAPAGANLIAQARGAGLPAFEGYGLSECASVQTLNVPGADRPGSVGRPLPHARVRVDRNGELEVAGTTMLGYLGDTVPPPAWWPTGDLGEIDADGFVLVRGRRKHVLVTGFGRNVSPEWVETALTAHDAVREAVVTGDGAAALGAVLWPSRPGVPDAVLDEAVQAANATLPDYARVAHWVRARVPFSAAAGTATPNGRPLRAAILALHAPHLEPSPDESSMSFHEQLQAATEADRAALLCAPIIEGAMRGEASVRSYVAFLTQAYHHVRHTVPLLAACRARLPERLAWMRPALDEYVDEETGHDAWVLADIAACGADAEAARNARPAPSTELMVAYAYDTVQRGNPVGLLGMVHVLEGTSVSLALAAADRLQRALRLPDSAFTYLRSHGTLDQEHTRHLASLLDALDDEGDREAVLHAARMFYRLYGGIFRELPLPVAQREAAAA